MASKVLSSNFRLGNTEKVWSLHHQLIKKGLKLKLFLPVFFYYFFYYKSFFVLQFFLYRCSAYWQFDFFLLRALKKFYFFKTRFVRTSTRYLFRRFVLHKRRKPLIPRTRVFLRRGLGGYSFNNRNLRVLFRILRRRKKYLKRRGRGRRLLYSLFTSFKQIALYKLRAGSKTTKYNLFFRNFFSFSFRSIAPSNINNKGNFVFFGTELNSSQKYLRSTLLNSSFFLRKVFFFLFYTYFLNFLKISFSALNPFYHYKQRNTLLAFSFYKLSIRKKLFKCSATFKKFKRFLCRRAGGGSRSRISRFFLSRPRHARSSKRLLIQSKRLSFLFSFKFRKRVLKGRRKYRRRLMRSHRPRRRLLFFFKRTRRKLRLKTRVYSNLTPYVRFLLRKRRSARFRLRSMRDRRKRRRRAKKLRKSFKRTLSLLKSLRRPLRWYDFKSLSYKYPAGQYHIRWFNAKSRRYKTFARFMKTFYYLGRRRFRFVPFKKIVKLKLRKYDIMLFTWLLQQPRWRKDALFARKRRRRKKIRKVIFFKLWRYYSNRVLLRYRNNLSIVPFSRAHPFSVRRRIWRLFLLPTRLKSIFALQWACSRDRTPFTSNVTAPHRSFFYTKFYATFLSRVAPLFKSVKVLKRVIDIDAVKISTVRTFPNNNILLPLIKKKFSLSSVKMLQYCLFRKYLSQQSLIKNIHRKSKLRLNKKIFLLFISLQLTLFLRIVCFSKIFSVLRFLNRSWYVYYRKTFRWAVAVTKLKKFERPWLRRFLLIFLTSFKLKNFKLFIRHLTQFFHKLSRHQYIPRKFFKTLVKSSLFQLKKIIGFKLTIKGKMNKRPRARLIQWFRNYKPMFQNLDVQIVYSARQVTTYFGSYMFRFWVYWYS